MKLNKKSVVKLACGLLLSFGIILLSLGTFVACGPTGGHGPAPQEERRPPRTPTGALLFNKKKTDSQLAQDKLNFLTNVLVERPKTGGTALGMVSPEYYSINNRYVDYRNQPYSPLIFGYYALHDAIRFTARFSDDFRFNIPQTFINEISKHDVDELEIFFAPQPYDGNGFKPHCWAARNPQNGRQYYYDAPLIVGIEDPDGNIDGDIKRGEFRSWGFTIHDWTLSPANPTLNIQDPNRSGSSSFLSLVVHSKERRAAVTLHVVLPTWQYNAIERMLRNDYPNGTFQSLKNQLDVQFRGESWLGKLDHLMR